MNEQAVFVSDQKIIWPATQEKVIEESAFDSGMRIAANSKFMGIRVPMRLHGLVRPQALEHSLQSRSDAGKPQGGVRWWLSEKVGEAPAIVDDYLVARTALNIESICKQMGYLNAQCHAEKDTLSHRTVEIHYFLNPGPLWSIASVDWADQKLGSTETTPKLTERLQMGEPFAVETLERTRINLAQDFRNKGFASIQASHINFLADTAVENGNAMVRLLVQLAPEGWTEQGEPRLHQQARFGKVSWSIEGEGDDHPLRAEVIEFLLAVEPDMRYNERVLKETQRRLSELPGVSRVDVPGSLNGIKNNQLVYDVDVLIHPAKRFGMTTALDMTRTDARYGPVLSWSLMDRIASQRGDEWDFHLSGGLKSTRPFSYSSDYLIPNSATWSLEAHYSTLGIPPISLMKLRPSNRARTDFAFSWARENRPEYAQNSLVFKWGFHFVENPNRGSEIRIDLLEFKRLKVESEADFRQWLDDQSNPFLTARFQDYSSVLSRVDWRTNWTVRNRLKGTLRLQAEWTGWGLEVLVRSQQWTVNELNQLLLGNIPFAHYFRTEAAWIWELESHQYSGLSWHGRVRGGWSITGDNFEGIPFDRAFFAGGANGLRGWTARDLGPGFADPENFDSGFIAGLGDFQGELSFEARKSLNDALEMAVFSDVGNVWLRGTELDTFDESLTFDLNSVAWGAGLGMRLDFDFFIFRLDAALRIHDPSESANQRWINKGRPDGAVHLGIGYPF